MTRARSVHAFAARALVGAVMLASSSAAEPRDVKIDVPSGRTLDGTLYVPSTVPAPGVLVLHTRGGLEPPDDAYAEALSKEGFVALVVGYLNAAWEGRLHHPGYAKDLSRVVADLAARPEVGGKPIGTVGFSLGAEKAVMLARLPSVKATVGYYGVYDLRPRPQSRGRKDLPPMPVDIADEIQAPVLLLHGEWDDETPIPQASSMRDALRNAGKTVELVVYPKAYHRFDRGPGRRMRGDRSAEGYMYKLDETARQDAWARTLAWFRKYLVTP